MTILFIALGGALGSVARFLMVNLASRAFGAGFPYGTMAVNVLGSFAMGFAVAMLVGRDGGTHPMAPFLMTGFLGGFTTFSAYSLDAYLLAETGRWGAFLSYSAGSVIASLIALAVGITLARMISG